jgi:hypothetical protein
VYDLSPAVQDYLLFSIAAGKAGDDFEGLRWARRALQERPNHPDALARAVTSFYNLKLNGAAPETQFPDETWSEQIARLAAIPQPAPGVRLVQGVALWKVGRLEEAKVSLRALLSPAPLGSWQEGNRRAADDALGVLLLTGQGDTSDLEQARVRIQDTDSFYLLVAVARRGSADLIPAPRRAMVKEAEPLLRNLFP